ncbi:hypothetical protein [Bacillus wiedmannii]|uniref:hypothetical protein n=1 Tax=Bacillus wiedmannii TaxID=1890302 RepID=UPI000BEFAB29|nr:hypothetical protein [Bacillus wiedmannii]PEK65718.1 hypothetical protein CN595_00075 [Bacillus wiedmannii]PEL65458.1 hypothetical protein CN622_04995 [Bacillus wiedmannii]PEU27431.1 hypothetical protein CN526_11435 [Bacillus wiedmannii]PHB42588.1 hypothetical protein COE82_07990 [Bacillus wiedmannii]
MQELQTLVKEIPIPYLPIFVSVFFILFKGIALLQTSNVEKIFFSIEKNIFIRFSHITIISLSLTFPLADLFRFVLQIPIQLDKNFLIAYFVMCFMFTFLITLQLYLIFFPDYLGKFAYYINHEEHGKLYIIKTINRKEILLYSHPRLYLGDATSDTNKSLILLKEDIKKKAIYREDYNISNFKFVRQTLTYHVFFKEKVISFWYNLTSQLRNHYVLYQHIYAILIQYIYLHI